MKIRQSVRNFFVDLVGLLAKVVCFAIRRHVGPLVEIGSLSKRGGFRVVPMRQCHFCGEIQPANIDIGKRFGGRQRFGG